MNTVAAECKAQRHHPEWSNFYNKTFVRWTTHSPPGLSDKDIHMAEFCNSITGKVTKVPSEEIIQRGRELADTVAQIGKDCCVPSKSKKNNGTILAKQESNLDGNPSSKGEETNVTADTGFDEVLKAYKETQAYKERERVIEEDKKRQTVRKEMEGKFPAAAAVEQAKAWLENKDRLGDVDVPNDEDIYGGQNEGRERIEEDSHAEDGKSK